MCLTQNLPLAIDFSSIIIGGGGSSTDSIIGSPAVESITCAWANGSAAKSAIKLIKYLFMLVLIGF